MSDFLDCLRRDFETRMTAHEGMLAHLGLDPSEEDAVYLLNELRATMSACGACRCPKTCIEWQTQGASGPPPWCHRRRTFLSLVNASATLEARIPAKSHLV